MFQNKSSMQTNKIKNIGYVFRLSYFQYLFYNIRNSKVEKWNWYRVQSVKTFRFLQKWLTLSLQLISNSKVRHTVLLLKFRDSNCMHKKIISLKQLYFNTNSVSKLIGYFLKILNLEM